MRNKSAVFRFLLTVFFVGCFALPTNARSDESRLFVPWKMFEARLQSLLADSAGLWRTSVGDMPLAAAGMTWNLKNLRFDAQVAADRPLFDGERLGVRLTKVSARIGLDSISVDQIVTREISGVVVRVHMKASCGPLRLIQENAQAEAGFKVDWSAGRPAASLQQMNLAWGDGSWQLADFDCEGPQGLDQLLKTEVLTQLKNPQIVKPYLEDWLRGQLQQKFADALAKLNAPLALAGDAVELHVGAMQPTTDGLLIPLTLDKDAPALPAPANLASLPKDRPVFLAGTATLRTLLEKQLAEQPELITIDLRTVSAFKSLIGSRFLQFFAWPDLMNYSKSAPFYARVRRPAKIDIAAEGDGVFSGPVDLRAVVQSQRDGRWWDYVTMNGQARAVVEMKLADGQLRYATRLENVNVSTGFGQDYKKRYGFTGWLPTSSLRSGLEGPQPALSGSVSWPDVDLGLGGTYRARTMKSLDRETVAIQFEILK